MRYLVTINGETRPYASWTDAGAAFRAALSKDPNADVTLEVAA